MGQMIQLSAADGQQIPAYVAQPAGAAKGAVVVIQEIFGVNSHIRNVEALPAPGVMQDIQAAIDYAAQTSGGKVGIVGYCWGGLLTWRSACTLKGLSAAVPYYGGGVTTEAEIARHPQVPVLAHFADEDKWIALDTVAAFKKAHPEVQVFNYAAHHGFNCDQRGAWDAPSAALARERSLAFFAKHLA